MQLTEQQLNELMAEMRGWEMKVHSRRPDAWYPIGKDDYVYLADPTLCVYHTDEAFTPTTDANQALECLEAWLMHDTVMRRSSFHQCWDRNPSPHRLEYHVQLRQSRNRFEEVTGDHKSLATAICLALASAEKGETVELKV